MNMHTTVCVISDPQRSAKVNAHLLSCYFHAADKPITLCHNYVSWFDDGKVTDVAIVEPQNENCQNDICRLN